MRLHENDTGSPVTQAFQLSERVVKVAEHLRRNPKDMSSRRGLIMLAWKRRFMLNFVKTHWPLEYYQLTKMFKLQQ